MAQTSVLNRMQWKYQAWLNGFNGGPMRQPSMRVTDPSMATLRTGLARSGIKPTELPDREFYIGRNPVIPPRPSGRRCGAWSEAPHSRGRAIALSTSC